MQSNRMWWVCTLWHILSTFAVVNWFESWEQSMCVWAYVRAPNVGQRPTWREKNELIPLKWCILSISSPLYWNFISGKQPRMFTPRLAHFVGEGKWESHSASVSVPPIHLLLWSSLSSLWQPHYLHWGIGILYFIFYLCSKYKWQKTKCIIYSYVF